MNTGYNPDFNPTGIEGGMDTNILPWLALRQAPGLAFKPLRASLESGMFTVIARITKCTRLAPTVHLGTMEFFVLSGAMTYPESLMAGTLRTGT